VLGIGGLLPGRQMTLRIAAIRRSDLQIEISVYMAGSASNVGVSVRQREARRTMVEFRSQPAVKRMAGVAGLRKLRGDVVWVGGFLKIRQVTRIASCRQSQVLANRRALVAIIALRGGVRAQQRKTILVVLQLLHRDIPTLHRMALRAVRAHLAPVDVFMTILALLSHIREHRFPVALRAFHFFMHPTQGITGFAVVKFRDGTDGSPSPGGVAVFARNRKGPMRAPGGLALGLGSE